MRQNSQILPAVMQKHITQLETLILSGRWSPGSKLPSERELAEQLAVSRPVVREILKILQAQRLIDIFPGKGSYVTSLAPIGGEVTVDQLLKRGEITTRQVVTARRMLEVEAAGLSAANRSEEDLAELAELLEQFEAADRIQRAIDLDVAFHEKVVVSSGNAVIQIMFGSIRDLVRGMIARSLSDRGILLLGAPIHFDILNAIRDKDVEGARKAARNHISLSEDTYGDDLDRPLADVLNQRAELDFDNKQWISLARKPSSSFPA